MNPRGRIRNRRQLLIVAFVGVSVFVGAIAAAVVDPSRAPAWLQLIPSTMTLLGVAVAYSAVRANAAYRRDDETAPARLLVMDSATSMYSHGSNEDVYWTVIVRLRNASSSESFTNILIEGVSLYGYGCQQTIRDSFREGGDKRFKLLPPGESVESGWVLPKPRLSMTSFDDDIPLQIRYVYSDGNGRRWRRLDALEPQRLREDDSTFDTRNAVFEEHMNARPNDAKRNLPTQIELAVKTVIPDE